MSDTKATPTEPEPASLANLTISADSTKSTTDGKNPSAETFTPGKFNWADDAETPTDSVKKMSVSKQEERSKDDDLAKAQTDGATTWLRGSEGLDEPEYNVNVKLADLQADPDNPLYSAKSFDDPSLGLKQEIQKALSTMGFIKPSKIQERALPFLLFQNPTTNMIGQSQSGTGKTAAFVINMLQRIDLSSTKPQAIVLAPTRELAKQIKGVVELMGTFLRPLGLLDVYEAVQGSDRSAIQGQIMVGTPGTVVDLLKRKLVDGRNVKVLTIDEADNMLDMQSMGDQCKRVKQAIGSQAQLVLFSATFPNAVLNFAKEFAPKANELTLEVEQLTVKGIKQMYLDCMNDEEKYKALVMFYKLMTIASSIIFVKRRDTAAEIERRLNAEGHSVVALTAALEGPARDAVFEKFRNGEAKVLIATNVLSRGIDVQTVTMVVNYDIPETVDGQPDTSTYLHRIGRTGRFGRTGAAISLVHDKRSWQALMAICSHFSVQPEKIDLNKMDDVEKQIKTIMKNQRNVVDVDMS